MQEPSSSEESTPPLRQQDSSPEHLSPPVAVSDTGDFRVEMAEELQYEGTTAADTLKSSDQDMMPGLVFEDEQTCFIHTLSNIIA